jgi:streptogramin lyase
MHVRAIKSRHRAIGLRLVGAFAVTFALLLCGALPAVAGASTRAHASFFPAVQVRALTLPGATYPDAVVTPAITTGPARTVRVKVTIEGKKPKNKKKKRKKRTKWVTKVLTSNKEWIVVTAGLEADLVAVSSTGKLTTVADGLLPPAGVPSGQINPLPSYGSVETDGQVWLLDYSVSPAPLYAVSPSGHVVQVASLPGDFTDLTAGPDNTLEAADNSGFIDRCTITKRPTAACTTIAVPTKFAGGQVDAIGQSRGLVWFTDDSGELGSFNPYRDSFAGPYGDFSQSGVTAGDASADPGTIVTAANGDVYVAAGEGTDPLFQNDLIRLLDPHQGVVLHNYSVGLTNVVAVTAGGDGNIWFLDATNPSTGAAKVGVLSTSSGLIHEYALPKGYILPSSGPGIAAGPVGSDTLFFTLQSTAGGQAAIGEVTGL